MGNVVDFNDLSSIRGVRYCGIGGVYKAIDLSWPGKDKRAIGVPDGLGR